MVAYFSDYSLEVSPMGQTALILSLVLAILIALFAIQNAGPATLTFGFWSVQTSLVVVILVSAAVGAAMASLLGLPGWIRDRRRLRAQGRELEVLRGGRAGGPLPPPDQAGPSEPDAPSQS
jgi:putative membrane protein